MSIIVAITGPSGAGKSTLTQQIFNRFSNDYSVSIMGEDDYYLPKDQQPEWLKEEGNYDHPAAFEHDLLIKHIEKLKYGKPIDKPVYCYKTHDRQPNTLTLDAPDILILEGLMLLQLDKVRELANLTLYVDLPQSICFERRLKRDIAERGRTQECVEQQYQSTVRPMFEQFIEPFRDKADIIVDRLNDEQKEFESVERFLVNKCGLK